MCGAGLYEDMHLHRQLPVIDYSSHYQKYVRASDLLKDYQIFNSIEIISTDNRKIVIAAHLYFCLSQTE